MIWKQAATWCRKNTSSWVPTLYWTKRDFSRRSHIKNDLTRKASRSFSKYAQADEPAARKAIALFSIERIRQSTHLGIRASDDFLACSTMFARYISREGELFRDDSMDMAIKQEMASEVLYDICYRFTHWDFIQLKRLGDALLQSTLVDVDEDLEAVVLGVFAEGDKLAGPAQELVAEAGRLLKQAKAAIIVYHQIHDQLPESLLDTRFEPGRCPTTPALSASTARSCH